MYIVAIANQKGGVGKTTTAHNLGVGLARHGKRVLLVDMDAQSNLTNACNVEPMSMPATIYEVLNGAPILDAIHHVVVDDDITIDLVAANSKFKNADFTFGGRIGRELLLKEALSYIDSDYDFCLLDCPPSVGIATLNAMAAAHGLLIPVQTQYFSITGLGLLTDSYKEMKRLNPNLDILGLVFTMYDSRTRLSKDVVDIIEEEWAGRVFDTKIPINVKVAEAPSHGKSVLQYTPDATGSKAYESLTVEFLNAFQ